MGEGEGVNVCVFVGASLGNGCGFFCNVKRTCRLLLCQSVVGVCMWWFVQCQYVVVCAMSVCAGKTKSPITSSPVWI